MTSNAPHEPWDAETNAAEWDRRYSESDSMWSGNPNEALIYAVTSLEPGTVPTFTTGPTPTTVPTALDVGTGEGADALWLAEHGFSVTAFDPSAVALGRARARDTQGRVTWVQGGIEDAPIDSTFNLVIAMYPVITHTEANLTRLLSFVAPHGRLVFVHHVVDPDTIHDGHFRFVVTPEQFGAFIDTTPGWSVALDETRARHVTTGAGSGHSTDRIVVTTHRA